MFSYRAYGLSIDSEFELPDIFVFDSATAPIPNLTITASPLPLQFDRAELTRFNCEVKSEGSYLNWPEIGTFLVSSDGQRVSADILPGINPDYISLALTGPVLGIALHNQGLLTLHAGAVKIADSACIVLGASGAGKSTLVASLLALGHELLCDDIVAIDIDPDSSAPITIQPGIARVKLWPDSAKISGLVTSLAKPLYEGFDKLSLSMNQDVKAHGESVHVSHILLLSLGDKITIEDAASKDSLLVLISNCYAGMMDKALGFSKAGQELLQCSRLQRETKILTLKRPADLNQISDVARCVEQAVLGH